MDDGIIALFMIVFGFTSVPIACAAICLYTSIEQNRDSRRSMSKEDIEYYDSLPLK